MGLYAIVDLPHPHGLSAEAATRAVLAEKLEGGTRGPSIVQLRAKQATSEQRTRYLAEMVPLCEAANVPLIVNDHVEDALDGPGVSGVHLGQEDPGASDVLSLRARAAQAGKIAWIVGLSTHNLTQVREAGRQGSDYIAFGPVADTSSKSKAEPIVGMDGLLDACRMAAAPVVAIGGMDLERSRRAVQLGATHVATIAALVAPTPAEIRQRSIALAEAIEVAGRTMSLEDTHAAVPVFSVEQLAEIARWSDDVGLHIEMGLPARFRPESEGDTVRYRPCDILDLTHALGKQPRESWEDWKVRTEDKENAPPLVRLRRD